MFHGQSTENIPIMVHLVKQPISKVTERTDAVITQKDKPSVPTNPFSDLR